ncbi:MAG TPA: RDD family protein [Stenotrophomonas sp.]|nr:RDD family protein [Stenotrophomonas sp.]
MTQWYYADAAGMQQGPVDAEALLALYAAGAIQPQSLVWREGLSGWQALATVAAELGLGAEVVEAVLPASAAPAAADVVYAGFWRRAAANLIDGCAIGLLAMPITVPMAIAMAVGMSQGEQEAAPLASLLMQAGIQVLVVLVTLIYYTCFHASRLMASPGKLAVGIKVVRGDGQRLTLGRSLGRGAAYYLSVITFYVGFPMAAFTQRKQGLHDLVCDTLVVDRWAFTDSPQLQRRGLDPVSVVILALYGVFLLLVLVMLIVVIAMAASSGFH